MTDNPISKFAQWLDLAKARKDIAEPTAMTLATADKNGQPSARMVLLRARDHRGFCFFTNYESDKGRDLAENPQAAILWYVEPLGRQVRIEGPVERLAPAESAAYFASRPRGHQLGAHASRQSRSIEDRRSLEEEVVSVEARFEGLEVPRPANWGGYRLLPARFEFWQHREDRLHDRIIYTPVDGGSWQRERHQP